MSVLELANDLNYVRQRVKGSPNGVCHFFVQLDKEWGIKFRDTGNASRNGLVEKQGRWSTDDDALASIQETYSRQKCAASAGLAPEVGEMIQLPVGSRTYHGYLTRVAFCQQHAKEGTQLAKDAFDKIYQDQWRELSDGLRDIGIDYGDMKPANCGVIGGKLVAVDFGAESCYDIYVS